MVVKIMVCLLSLGLLSGCSNAYDYAAPVHGEQGGKNKQHQQKLIPNNKKLIQHTVQRGDSLSVLAQRYGTTVEAIMERNNVSAPDHIRLGHVLLIKPGEGKNKKPKKTTTQWSQPLFWPVPEPRQVLMQQQNKDFWWIPTHDLVQSIAEGDVIFSSKVSRSLKHVVVIKHQDNLYSFYGHLKHSTLKSGDHIPEQAAIGLADNKEGYGPVLIFQIRHQDRAVNPLNIIPKI